MIETFIAIKINVIMNVKNISNVLGVLCIVGMAGFSKSDAVHCPWHVNLNVTITETVTKQ